MHRISNPQFSCRTNTVAITKERNTDLRTIIFRSQEIKTKKTSVSVLDLISSLREASTFVLDFS